MQIDDRIKQAQRKGAGGYLLGALLTVVVVVSVLSWLFLVRGYAFNIGPQDAEPLALISVESGTAWHVDRTVYTLGGTVEVSVKADTFETAFVTITPDSPSNVEVVLQPSPAVLTANIDVPGESSWYVDDELVFVGNALEYSVAQGSYRISMINPFYEPWETNISAKRAQSITLVPELRAVQGTANINTVPSGADVFINNEAVGKTPIAVPLIGGKYSLTASLKDFQDIKDEISITYMQDTPERNYQLLAVQSQLNISASPSGGVLLINNLEELAGIHALDAKTPHRVEYRKPGYFTFVTQITLAPNEQRDLNIALEQELGKLTMSSNVEANLSIDGAAPVRLTQQQQSINLAAKATQLRVSREGYRTITQTITPSSKRELVLNIELLTEFEARRKEGRPLVANQIGINLLRFSPDAFVMGSAPNETGRRRNEHQVKVDFTRDFWVSEKEITQAQYAAFKGQSSKSNLPQADITWNDAALFCNWLSVQEGLPPFYQVRDNQVLGYTASSNGYRLPTEAEWEWLAKKAKRSRSTVFVWGNQTRIPTNVGNFADQSAKNNQLIVLDRYDDKQAGVADVGSFKADRVALYDLAGNVSEWTNDFYTTALPDTEQVQVNYMGAQRGTQYVVKGGNYASGRLRELRAAYREVGESPKPTIGFRIARYQ